MRRRRHSAPMIDRRLGVPTSLGPRILVALPARYPLRDGTGVTRADLAGDTFIVRHCGTGPQVHDHIVTRLVGNAPDLSILRFGVNCITLLSKLRRVLASPLPARRQRSCKHPA